MANDLTGMTWSIDTVMATPYTSNVHISAITWDAPSAIGHKVVIKDLAGRTITELTAQAISQSVTAPRMGWVPGFQVTQIDSGRLTIGVGK